MFINAYKSFFDLTRIQYIKRTLNQLKEFFVRQNVIFESVWLDSFSILSNNLHIFQNIFQLLINLWDDFRNQTENFWDTHNFLHPIYYRTISHFFQSQKVVILLRRKCFNFSIWFLLGRTTGTNNRNCYFRPIRILWDVLTGMRTYNEETVTILYYG